MVAPPRTGKTMMLQSIAAAITANHPEVYLIVLLIDERPEEVTDMQRSVNGGLFPRRLMKPTEEHVGRSLGSPSKKAASCRTQARCRDPARRHYAPGAYNIVVPSSGKVLTGGVDANALQRPKLILRCRVI